MYAERMEGTLNVRMLFSADEACFDFTFTELVRYLWNVDSLRVNLPLKTSLMGTLLLDFKDN